jgi:hypothetical protein
MAVAFANSALWALKADELGDPCWVQTKKDESVQNIIFNVSSKADYKRKLLAGCIASPDGRWNVALIDY